MDATKKRNFVVAIEQTHGRALRRFLANRMRNARGDVPDLVQEVYLRLLRIPDPEAIRNPQAYLYTIASHVLHQHTLRRTVRGALIDPADFNAELEATAENDPAEQTQLEQRFEQLGKGLEQHSPRAYVTLMLSRCEGCTLEEIGRRLGVSRPMAAKYLIKALAYCHQRLEELE